MSVIIGSVYSRSGDYIHNSHDLDLRSIDDISTVLKSIVIEEMALLMLTSSSLTKEDIYNYCDVLCGDISMLNCEDHLLPVRNLMKDVCAHIVINQDGKYLGHVYSWIVNDTLKVQGIRKSLAIQTKGLSYKLIVSLKEHAYNKVYNYD